jgi:hypothetical protein
MTNVKQNSSNSSFFPTFMPVLKTEIAIKNALRYLQTWKKQISSTTTLLKPVAAFLPKK